MFDKSIDNTFELLRKFGRLKVQIFIYLHLQAMKAKVSTKPELAALIAATQQLYNNLFGNVKDKNASTKLRIAQTKAVQIAVNNFKVAARQVYQRVLDKLHADSPICMELFGDGLKSINKIKLIDAFETMVFLKDGVTKYVIEIGVDMQTLIDTAYSNFEQARDGQTQTKSKVEQNNPDYKKNLDLMIIQLYVNLHSICTSNPTKISESKTYFNDSVLLTPSRRKGKNSKIIPETLGIEAGMQKTAISAYGPGQTVTIKNLTDFPAYYFGAVTATELIQPSSLMIPPHSEITVTSEQLGSPNNKFLIIGNKETLETSLLVVQITVQ